MVLAWLVDRPAVTSVILGARDLKLVPLCPFVRTYLRRHPEHADLVVSDRAAPR
jgi:predicted GNAT family acetyltransferase